MRIPSSRNSFWDHFGGPKEAKIDQKSSSDDVKNEESEKLDFLHLSHAKSLLLGANGGQDGAQMRIKTDFYTD